MSGLFKELDAAAVKYQPAGTGAVATTVQTVLRETVSVKDFGAVGDGVEDDTAAIQLALNTASGIFFPAGKYRITSQITVYSDTFIHGDGKRKSVIAADFSTTGVYILYANAKSNITVRDVSLWGNLTENAGANKAFAVAYISGCSNVIFYNCEVSTCTTHTISVTKNFSTVWIQAGNANSQASVDSLYATCSSNIRLSNCSFRYAGSNHFAAFGVNGLWITDCDFSSDVTFYDILIDGASQATVLADYAVNRNVNISSNIGSHGMLIVDTATGNIEGNKTSAIYYNSYDFDQQLLNLASPFFHLNYAGSRMVRIRNNEAAVIQIKSTGYVDVDENFVQSVASADKLIKVDQNSIVWTGPTTYYDSITTTAIDTSFPNTKVSRNTLVAAHTNVVGIGDNGSADLYRLCRDNVFVTKGSGTFATKELTVSGAAMSSQLFGTTNLKVKRQSRFINEVLDSGITTITVLSGAKSANTTIAFNYNGYALNSAPLVFATIQNSNSVIPAAQEPAVASAFSVTTSGASLAIWLAANAAADIAVTVAWVVVAQ